MNKSKLKNTTYNVSKILLKDKYNKAYIHIYIYEPLYCIPETNTL